MKYFGWQVGITYGSNRPHGLDLEYFLNLLDEMQQNRMNYLSLMMISYGFFDKNHDGYCWPVRNSKLICYKDNNAINSIEETEFLSKVIEAAAQRNIEIELFLNWGIWNNQKIRTNYPNSTIQIPKHGDANHWLHCPDSIDAWQFGLDAVADLLDVYDHPNVKRYCFERISYSGNKYCYCEHTKAKFKETTGNLLENTNKKDFFSWRTQNIGKLISEYSNFIKKSRPEIKVGLHTQGKKAWGHDPNKFNEWGIDYLEPHTIQFKTSKRKFYKKMAYLSPNPCILHFDARNIAPNNYPIWIKTPQIIRKVMNWVYNYKGSNIEGFVFFNEPSVSQENKEEIYRQIPKFFD